MPGRSKNGLLRLKGYHQDVSELESMRERLRENLSRFETACRIGRIGVFECTRGSRILFSANDIFFEQFGIPADMVCFSAFRGLWSRIAPGCRKRVLEALRRSSWKPGRCERFEIELLDPEKGSRWFDFECEFSRDGDAGRLATSPTSPSTSSMRLPCAWPPRQRRPPTGPSHPSSPT